MARNPEFQLKYSLFWSRHLLHDKTAVHLYISKTNKTYDRKGFLLSNLDTSRDLSNVADGNEKVLRNIYMCGFRLLQWLSERLPVDLQSCTMRGMSPDDWYNAYQLLMSVKIIDCQSRLLLPLPHALSHLWAQLELALGETNVSSDSRPKNSFSSESPIGCTSMMMLATLVNRKDR